MKWRLEQEIAREEEKRRKQSVDKLWKDQDK